MTLTFNPVTSDMIDSIQKEMGLDFGSQVVKCAIHAMYHKMFPVYKDKLEKKPKTMEDKIIQSKETKEEREKAIAKVQKDSLIALATNPYPIGLAGTITGDVGKEIVEYWSYFEQGRDKVTLPLVEIDKDLIGYQYQPSYEEVLRLQKLKKVNY